MSATEIGLKRDVSTALHGMPSEEPRSMERAGFLRGSHQLLLAPQHSQALRAVRFFGQTSLLLLILFSLVCHDLHHRRHHHRDDDLHDHLLLHHVGHHVHGQVVQEASQVLRGSQTAQTGARPGVHFSSWSMDWLSILPRHLWAMYSPL